MLISREGNLVTLIIQPVEKVHVMCGGAIPTPMISLSVFARRETFPSHRSLVQAIPSS